MSKVENTICSICLTSPLHPIQPSDQPTTTHWFGLCSLQDSQTATAQTQRKNVVVIMSFRTKLCHLQSCTCAALFRLYELALWYPRPMSAEMCLIPTRMKHQKVCNITHLGTRLQDATRCYEYILHWYSLIFIDSLSDQVNAELPGRDHSTNGEPQRGGGAVLTQLLLRDLQAGLRPGPAIDFAFKYL